MTVSGNSKTNMPTQGSTVVILNPKTQEVLLHKREDFRVWSLPGGKIEPGESWEDAAIRETFEETGIAIDDVERLVPTSRWITPVGAPKRFDTYFFLAKAPDMNVTIDGSEIVDHVWITPADALKQLKMIFPTIKNLEALLGFDSADALLESRRGAVIEPVQPVLVNGKPTLP